MSAEGLAEKRTVVLLFGGRSSEHGISCVTAAGVLRAIDRSRFDVIPVGITKRGATVLLSESDLADYRLEAGALPEVVENGTRVLWPASIDSKSLTLIKADGSITSLGHVDAVLPTTHGPFGEDGTIQGMLELIDLPYVGSGVLGSALAMDKHVAKTVLADAGIAVAPWRTVTAHEISRNPGIASSLDEGLHYPLFVKPARAGSSVGVSRVTEPTELPAALDIAFAEDSVVLIESGVTGREVEIAVLQGRDGAAPRTSTVIGEIVFTGRAFYDFEAKYLDESSVELTCPADLSPELVERVRELAVRTFEAVGCEGLARVDVFVTPEGDVIVNEINTMPGFTPFSMYPRMWERTGLPYGKLIDELIELALERPTGLR